jgi:hypothetical protein
MAGSIFPLDTITTSNLSSQMLDEPVFAVARTTTTVRSTGTQLAVQLLYQRPMNAEGLVLHTDNLVIEISSIFKRGLHNLHYGLYSYLREVVWLWTS